MTDPAAKLAKSVRALLDGGGIHNRALADAAEADLKKYEAAVSTESESDERGIPILSIDAKLAAFRKCLFSEYNTEDAIGHVLDLLVYTIDRLGKQQTSPDDIREIVEAYAAHPTKILDPE